TTKSPVLQLMIYPAVDFLSETPSMHDFADAWPLTAETVDYFMKQYLPDNADPGDPRLSPIRTQDLRGLAPALIYTAGFDMLLDQGKAFSHRLREAGAKPSYTPSGPLPHAFVASPPATRAAKNAIRQIAREAAAALKGQR